jgi:hypothetical protein
MASYGMAEYSPPQTVSDHIRMCIFGLIIRTHQYATAPYIMYPPAGAEFVEGIPQHQQVIFRVGVNFSSPHIFSTKTLRCR